MKKKIVISIVIFLAIASIVTGVFIFINKNKELDMSMWEELEIGMDKDEAIEKIYYRFGRENCKRTKLGTESYNGLYKIENVDNIMGCDGVATNIMYIFEDDKKLVHYFAWIDFEDEEGEIDQVFEMITEYFDEKSRNAKTYEYSQLYNISVSNDDKIYVIGEEMFFVSKWDSRISVSCDSVPEDMNSVFE